MCDFLSVGATEVLSKFKIWFILFKFISISVPHRQVVVGVGVASFCGTPLTPLMLPPILLENVALS